MNLAYSSKCVFKGYGGCFVYYEIFIDVFLVTNMVMDYFLLRIVSRILRCSATHLRSLAAAVFGALALCLLIIIQLSDWRLLNTVLVHVVINTLMVKFGCKIKGWKKILQGLLLLYLASFLTGGLLTRLQTHLTKSGFWTFLLLAAVSYLVITAGILVYTRLKGNVTNLYEVVLYAGGKCKEVKGLYDTGNRLFDTLSKKPVSIVDESVVESLFSQDELLQFHPHYIPFQSVGCTQGVILAVTLDSLVVKNETMSRTVDQPVIALAKGHRSFAGQCQMILNPDLVDG